MRRGFTLLEAMICIAIVAVCFAIALPFAKDQPNKEESTTLGDMLTSRYTDAPATKTLFPSETGRVRARWRSMANER